MLIIIVSIQRSVSGGRLHPDPSRTERTYPQPIIHFSESTEDMSNHLGMAIDALRDLDEDNRMVARCRDYLEQFVQIIRSLGK